MNDGSRAADSGGGLLALTVVVALVAIVAVPIEMSSDLRSGERVVLSCDAEGSCELRQADAFGPFRVAGHFPEVGLVGTDAHCDTELRSSGDDFQDPVKVRLCRPGIWVVGWDGPASPPEMAEEMADYRGLLAALSPHWELPPDAEWVSLAQRAHRDWTIDPDGEVERLRPGNEPWTLEYSSARWASYPVQAAVTAVVTVLFASPMLAALVVSLRSR